MPFDSSGNHSLPAGYRAVTGQTVLPSNHNPPLEDLSAALSQVLVKDGRAAMTGDLPMNGNKITGLAEGTAETDAATVGQAASAIGDFKDSVRDLGEKWLRRNGALYDAADYPDLAEVLPSLPDGLDVTQRHSGAGNIRKILQGDGKYVALAADGKVSISTDRQTWYTTISGVSVLGNVSVAAGSNSCYGLGMFFSSTQSRDIAISTDGESWSDSEVMPSGVNSTVVYFDGSYVYAFGISGDNSTFSIMRTDNGADWTDITPTDKGLVRWAAHSGSALIAVAGGTVLVSTDQGASWTASTPGTVPGAYDGIWTGAKFLSVGVGGVVRDSTNGTSWTSRTSGTSNDLYAVARSSAGALIGGNSGTLRLSTDEGLNWTGVVSGTSARITAIMADEDDPSIFLIGTESGLIIEGIKTSPTQFRVPGDDPDYGWIRALA